MYENYFGFVEKPFNLTPDTYYLYPSSQHEGALQALLFGIRERKGFLLLTGEVGTGKTTLIRSLISQLGPDIITSLVLNPLVSTSELVARVNKDFGVQVESNRVEDHLDALTQFLLEKNTEGKNIVIIIDEAQNLTFEALELTRLISNLETERQKLLQIILVGQPELEEKIYSYRLRQLAQRIQIHCKLEPFDYENIEKYISYRISRAGNSPSVVFEKSAIKKILKHSHGIPRIINSICDLALMAAYAEDTRIISSKIMKKVVKEAPSHVHYS